MNHLITDNTCLLRYVPNVMNTVQGELSLYDKIAPHLEMAEQWLTTHFLSEVILEDLFSADGSNKLLHYARMATTAEALLHAVPSLDLILTPNGFGIVNNANLVPASKERMERLLLSLEKTRDDALQVLLPLLSEHAAWKGTAPCDFFASTLYPWLDLPHRLGKSDHLWQSFQSLHEKQRAIEEHLAHDFFSCELMEVLRQGALFSNWNDTASAPQYKSAWQHILAIVLFMLREEDPKPPLPSCIEVVNVIRNTPDGVFGEWKQSVTASLYENHGYRNDKKKGGFWL